MYFVEFKSQYAIGTQVRKTKKKEKKKTNNNSISLLMFGW